MWCPGTEIQPLTSDSNLSNGIENRPELAEGMDVSQFKAEYHRICRGCLTLPQTCKLLSQTLSRVVFRPLCRGRFSYKWLILLVGAPGLEPGTR